MTDFNAILCRTNAGCVGAAMQQYAEGRKVALLISGGLDSLRSFADAADRLMNGQSVDHPELGAFKSWGEVVEYAKGDEGADLAPWVRLIEEHGSQAIRDVCNNSLSEKQAHLADVQVVTAHRSKGLEWDRVLIAGDFKPPKDGRPIRPEDLRLMYVAVTRARLFLDCRSIAWAINPEAL